MEKVPSSFADAFCSPTGLEVGSAKCIKVNVEEGHKLGMRHVGGLGHAALI